MAAPMAGVTYSLLYFSGLYTQFPYVLQGKEVLARKTISRLKSDKRTRVRHTLNATRSGHRAIRYSARTPSTASRRRQRAPRRPYGSSDPAVTSRRGADETRRGKDALSWLPCSFARARSARTLFPV